MPKPEITPIIIAISDAGRELFCLHVSNGDTLQRSSFAQLPLWKLIKKCQKSSSWLCWDDVTLFDAEAPSAAGVRECLQLWERRRQVKISVAEITSPSEFSCSAEVGEQKCHFEITFEEGEYSRTGFTSAEADATLIDVLTSVDYFNKRFIAEDAAAFRE